MTRTAEGSEATKVVSDIVYSYFVVFTDRYADRVLIQEFQYVNGFISRSAKGPRTAGPGY